MEPKPYEFDRSAQWIQQQKQRNEARNVITSSREERPPTSYNQKQLQTSMRQGPKTPERMPKARTLALVRIFKKYLVVASVFTFGTFSGLAAFHQVSSAHSQTSTGASQSTPVPSSTSQNSNGNGFFNQQGGNNFGTGSSSQAPVTGSQTS